MAETGIDLKRAVLPRYCVEELDMRLDMDMQRALHSSSMQLMKVFDTLDNAGITRKIIIFCLSIDICLRHSYYRYY